MPWLLSSGRLRRMLLPSRQISQLGEGRQKQHQEQKLMLSTDPKAAKTGRREMEKEMSRYGEFFYTYGVIIFRASVVGNWGNSILC